jgi:hypothetical protein
VQYLESPRILCLLQDQLFPAVINHRPPPRLFETSLNMVHTLNNNISHLINEGSTYVSSIPARYIAPVVGQTEVCVGNNCNAILFCL